METTSADETRAVGSALAVELRPGDVVLLVGGLGAGKTTLVQGIVAALGGTEHVTSPTFTLVHTYRTNPAVAHVDLWRLEHLKEIVDLALEEEIDNGSIVVAEWGEAADDLLGPEALVVHLEPGLSDNERLIGLDPRGAGWKARLRSRDHGEGRSDEEGDG
jgi:tRNA threonylcarbamoyladenosine biosynthesis protein TsaE